MKVIHVGDKPRSMYIKDCHVPPNIDILSIVLRDNNGNVVGVIELDLT